METVLDHVGIAVRDIQETLAIYGKALGMSVPEPDQAEEISEQDVRVLLFPATGGSRLELLEPIGSNGAVARFLEQRGPGLHHLAFRVKDIHLALQQARAAGLELVDEQPRRGAGGHLVAFVHPKSAGGVLIEFCQEEV